MLVYMEMVIKMQSEIGILTSSLWIVCVVGTILNVVGGLAHLVIMTT